VRRRQKEGVGVIEGIERSRDLRKREIHGFDCLDFALSRFDAGFPINSVKLGIVIVFFYVGGDLLEHGQRAIAIHGGNCLAPAIGGTNSDGENQDDGADT
jgi:hypothetical protein